MKTKIILILAISAAVSSLFYIINRKERICNVVLISMDTTRADYLSCYGYPQKTTPNIDALAQHGVLFEKAISPVPLTLPSHSTMLTGTIPPYHGVHDNSNNYLDDSNLTITETLQENGFSTVAIIGAYVLDSQFGLGQGFDYYNDQFEKKPNQYNESERVGKEITENAINWIDEHKDEKFFMFLHYYDPHAEYTPPEPFATQFKHAPYAGEIAYTDHCIGEVIDRLKKLKIYDSSLILITSDHGEAFGEHGENGHSYFIYQQAIKVPLIIKLPGNQTTLRIKDHTVGLVDIFPTVCSLLGLNTPEHIQGKDLSPLMKEPGNLNDERFFYCESLTPTKYNANSLLGLVGEKYKYIETSRPELYDLIKDPAESQNLVDSRFNLARILQDKLKRKIESAVSNRTANSKIELDTESIKRLESLGYVSGSVTEDFSFDRSKYDPKDVLNLYHINSHILVKLTQEKKIDEAKELCLTTLAEYPDIEALYLRLVGFAKEQKDLDAGIKNLKKLIELSPDNLQYTMTLADTYIDASKYELATKLFQEILAKYPDQPYAYAKLGTIYIEKKDYKQAFYYLNESLKIDPFQIIALNYMAKIYDDQKDAHKTIEYINKSLSINLNQPETLNTLATVYYSQGEVYKAIETWEKVLEFTPDDTSANNNVAWTRATNKDKKLRDPSRAVVLAQKACRLTEYKDPSMLDTLSAAYASAGNFTKAVETAEQGIRLAESTGNTTLASKLRKRLSLYKKSRAYIE